MPWQQIFTMFMVPHFFLAQLHLHLLFTVCGPLVWPCHTRQDHVPKPLVPLFPIITHMSHVQPSASLALCKLVRSQTAHVSKTNSSQAKTAIFMSAHCAYNAKSSVCCLKFYLLIWFLRQFCPPAVLHLHMRLIPLKPGGSL